MDPRAGYNRLGRFASIRARRDDFCERCLARQRSSRQDSHLTSYLQPNLGLALCDSDRRCRLGDKRTSSGRAAFAGGLARFRSSNRGAAGHPMLGSGTPKNAGTSRIAKHRSVSVYGGALVGTEFAGNRTRAAKPDGTANRKTNRATYR